MELDTIVCADALSYVQTLPDESVHLVVSSPSYYGLRRYLPADHPSQDLELGTELTPEQYIESLVIIFQEVRRVLRSDGSAFLNFGDSFWSGKGQSGQDEAKVQQDRHAAGKSINKAHHQVGGKKKTRPTDGKHEIYKPKDLMMIPSRVALALQADGWTVRNMTPWIKRSPMPNSTLDRSTIAHEYIFHIVKSRYYYFDMLSISPPVKSSTVTRLSQPNFANQQGGDKDYANGTNPNRSTRRTAENLKKKQDQLGKRTYTGFNDRYFSQEEPTLTRHPRTSDTWFDSLDAEIEDTANRLKMLRDLRTDGGVLPDGDDSIAAIITGSEPLDLPHFAAFPTKLIRPLILSGCPQFVCSMCGTPYKRDIEYGDAVRSGGMAGNSIDHADGPMDRGGKRQWDKGAMPTSRPMITLGWSPTCECDAPSDTGICLDPFMGSGTTAVVARSLGRHYLGCDLNSAYVDMALDRLRQPFEPLMSAINESLPEDKQIAPGVVQPTLFGKE